MKSILIAGVGGQGTLLASMVFGQIALKMGCDVKLSEVHGMAQRGGSVVTYVRIGDKGEKVYSPVIDECGAAVSYTHLPVVFQPCQKRDQGYPCALP